MDKNKRLEFESIKTTCERFGVSRQTVYVWLNKKEIEGLRDETTSHWKVIRGAVPVSTYKRREIASPGPSEDFIKTIDECL